MPRIAIIIGSTRPGRKAPAVARWVNDIAGSRDDATFELVDLADYDLPHLDEPAPAAMGPSYTQPHTHAWADKIASFDGYIFVTPEYNHSITGVLKTPSITSTSNGTTRPPASSPTASLAAPAPSSTCG